MDIYDVAVIGAGAAGTIAAIRAGQSGKRVALVERNDAIGRKILLTGKGRCNITNTARIEELIGKFTDSGKFLRSAFSAFDNEDLAEFFSKKGLDFKTERQGRVFPATDSAASVIKVLNDYLSENNVEIIYNSRVKRIEKDGRIFRVETEGGVSLKAARVVLATGGASYAATGSSGDGFRIAKELGHTVVPLRPGLVPLKTRQTWVKDAQGLTLKNVRLVFVCGKKRIVSTIGEMLFTHFGISGPLVLDLSHQVVLLLEENAGVELFIDLKPGLTTDQVEKRLLEEIKQAGGKELKNLLKTLLPLKLIPVFGKLLKLEMGKKASQIKQDERLSMVKLFKSLPLTITGYLPIEEAMVTGGGVSLKEIDPRTMESKVVPGLYLAGEVIDGCAASGGYNLQQAFSTGYLAGEAASHA